MSGHDYLQNETQIALFNGCEFARILGMEIIEARAGYARVVMNAKGKANPNNVIHGGAIFSVADQAFAIAGNLDNIPRVAISASIMYLSPATGQLEAVAERVGDNEQHSVYHIRVYEDKRLVATFEGVGIKMPANDT